MLVKDLESRGKWADVRRIDELSHHSTSHDWLWALNPAHGACIPPCDYSDALRVRFGAP